MKRIKIVGLCLIALFAFSAVAAASAFAEGRPEYKLCAKVAKVEGKYNGSYSDKGCTTEATGGKYEREEVAENTAFTGRSNTRGAP